LFRNLPVTITGLALVACLIVWFMTRDPNAGSAKPAAGRARQSMPVDQQLLQTATEAAASADTLDEQGLAREALRLSDHELDLEFATLLREAAEAPPPASGPLKELGARIVKLKTQVASDQASITRLTPRASTDDDAATQLLLTKAQLELDQNELDDAQQDLARRGGDEHVRIENLMKEHEGAQHLADQMFKPVRSLPVGTLAQQFQAWLALRDKGSRLLAAQQQALNRFAFLTHQHNALAGTRTAAPVGGDLDNDDVAAAVARLRGLSNQTRTLSDLNKRIQDTLQLSGVYQRWGTLVQTLRRETLHLLLRSVAWILLVLLGAILIHKAIRGALSQHADRRKLHQLRVVASIAVQLVVVVAALLIIFGPPNQISTFLGLLTAGLTVVLKDFIVAFFGWFVLLGRNGIRLGDWVEIEGVGGEVIEIGMLRTYLLEMGNWTSTGHPTGRRVGFINSFAIEGHYFNFSTTGQWLWDELQVMLPGAGNPYELAEQIRRMVESQTEKDAKQAEQDWERVTSQYGVRAFSARPAVDLRPLASGLEVVVRYITRAPLRYEVKTRLFQSIVDLLQKAGGAPAPVQAAKPATITG
jgi:small-conductance mechanosensitive channel